MPSKRVSEPPNVPPPDTGEDDGAEQTSNRPFWSGTISLGW